MKRDTLASSLILFSVLTTGTAIAMGSVLGPYIYLAANSSYVLLLSYWIFASRPRTPWPLRLILAASVFVLTAVIPFTLLESTMAAQVFLSALSQVQGFGWLSDLVDWAQARLFDGASFLHREEFAASQVLAPLALLSYGILRSLLYWVVRWRWRGGAAVTPPSGPETVSDSQAEDEETTDLTRDLERRMADQFTAFNNKSIKAFLTYLVFGLALLYGFLWIAVVILYRLHGSQGLGLVDQLYAINWLGAYILLLEISSCLQPKKLQFKRFLKTHTHKISDVVRSVDPLYLHYKDTLEEAQTHSDERKAKRKASSLSPSAGEEDDAADFSSRLAYGLQTDCHFPGSEAKKFDAFMDDASRGQCSLLFDESLSKAHILVCTRLIQSCQDAGGTTLVVCPDGFDRAIKRVFASASSAYPTSLVQEIHRVELDSLPHEKAIYSLVIVPEGLIAPVLLGSGDRYERILGNLKLLIILEIQRLDHTLLRLHYQRLKLKSGGFENLVIQGQGQQGLRDFAANVLRDDTAGRLQQIHLEPEGYSDRYLIVWPGSAKERVKTYIDSQYDFGGAAVANDLAQLLTVPAFEQGFQPNFLDPDGHFNAPAWRDFSRKIGNGGTRIGDAEVPIVRIGPEEQGNVIIAEDWHNLAAKYQRNFNGASAPSLLIHLISDEYPMRNFLAEKIDEEKANRNGAIQDYLPLSPAPGTGVTELSYSLAAELLEAGPSNHFPELRVGAKDKGIKPLALKKAYFEPGLDNLFAQLRISASKSGLERLFMLGLDADVAIERLPHEMEQHEERFCLPADVRDEVQLNFRRPVLGPDLRQLATVPWGDFGLSYAVDTDLLIDGQSFRIDSYRAHDGAVTAIPFDSFANPGANSKSRPVFDSRYSLDFEHAFVETTSPRFRAGPVEFEMTHFHMNSERKTLGRYLVEPGNHPWSPGVRQFYEGLIPPVDMPLKLKSVLHLRIASPPGEPIAVETDNQELSRLARTLCVLLNDAVWSLFPVHAHRIAILSPQVDTPGNENETFLHQFYPSLHAEAGCPIKARLSAPKQQSDGVLNEDGRAILDLYVVEDADHDLGVARAIPLRRRDFFSVVYKFAAWLGADPANAEGAYVFEAEELSRLFDFEGAAQLLRRLGQVKQAAA